MRYLQQKIKRITHSGNKRPFSCVLRASTAFMLAILSISVFLTCTTHAEKTAFEVNVKESLSVSITYPNTPATGGVDTFLRNKYTLNVSTNNAVGFTASMYTPENTNLVNSDLNNQTIPTLSTGYARGNFPTDYWGYSLGTTSVLNGNTYNETDAGNEESNYYPLVSTPSTPITVLTRNGSGSSSQDIYFGTKASTSKAAGEYSSIVVISVVSGVIDAGNPVTPSNPTGPNREQEVAKYMPAPRGGTNGTTTYTYSNTDASAGTTTVTTQVSDGDNRSSYEGYIPPQGARENLSSNINNDSSIAAGLATTAAVAAAAGVTFFVVAKQREGQNG